ncbi:MAG: MrpF/PhaF family protein [Roseococcus sp.]|nr:MrpF/PhaF family protein [Roseococcus sp.]
MTTALILAAALILLAALAGLTRALRGPAAADRMMAAQLLCSGGIGALLLVAIATDLPGVVDVALVLALLGAFASIAFVLAARGLGEK